MVILFFIFISMSQNLKTFLFGLTGGLIGAFIMVFSLQTEQSSTKNVTTDKSEDVSFTTQADPKLACKASCDKALMQCSHSCYGSIMEGGGDVSECYKQCNESVISCYNSCNNKKSKEKINNNIQQ